MSIVFSLILFTILLPSAEASPARSTSPEAAIPRDSFFVSNGVRIRYVEQGRDLRLC